MTRQFEATGERRTAAETDARRSRRAQIDRLRRRLNTVRPKDSDLIELQNAMKAIVDIMADDGKYE